MDRHAPAPWTTTARFRTLLVLAMASLSGCLVGPDYVRPTVDAPEAWRIEYPKAAEVANTKWWEQFDDPVLNGLVETALRENLDVRIAAARVEQFMGGVTSTRSQLFPQFGYGANATMAKASEVAMPPLPPTIDPTFSLYEAQVGVSWKIDLFGRVRRLTEAAQAQVYASEQAQRGVVLSLVTGVASSYIALRALDRQLEIAQSTARNFVATERIFNLRFKAGIVAKTEVMQITSQAQQALAAIPAFEQAIAAQENLISVLLGRNPGPIQRGKTIDQLVAPLIPGGLPSELLLRRPDVLQAEQNLVAANASIGAARALYYPSFDLTGVLGTASTAFGDLFSGASGIMALIGAVTGPIFTFGAIEGQVRSAEAQTEQALLFYRQVILGAFRETDNALTGSQKRIAEYDAQKKRVDALREFARLSKLRFDRGMAGYLEVLVAENELFAAELASVGLLAARYTQIVSVYQAMGGGWVDVAASMGPKIAGAPAGLPAGATAAAPAQAP